MTTPTHITQRDIKILPSERLTDNPDGGGLPVNTPLTGADNEVFNPVALLDRISGDWSARIVYSGLDCPDATPLYRSFFAITEPAKDPAVAYLAMPAKQFAESRMEIADSVQSGRVLDDFHNPAKTHTHIAGTVTIEMLERYATITTGDVLYVQAEYIATAAHTDVRKKYKYGEFVKVSAVEHFIYPQLINKATGETMDVDAVRLTLTKPLTYSYTFDYILTKSYTSVDESSFLHHIFTTKIVENDRYYGVKPITTDIAKNSASIQVTSCTEKIAPVINNEVIEVDGIDVLKLPQDGNVQILKEMDEILISNLQSDDLGTAHTGGQTVQLSRTNVNRICLRDADKTPINAELWSYDLQAGTVTWTSPLDLSMYTMPIIAIHSQEEGNRILKVNADNTLDLQFPTLHDYPLVGTYVSSIIDTGDLQVWHSIPFTQRNWDGSWRDEPQGEQLLNKLNLTDYPAVLTDDGTINERFLIKWLDDTNFEFWGERLGYLGRYDRLTDFAPLNPSTGKPLMTIQKEAFGNNLDDSLGWATHDIIRINTKGTLVPIRLIRVVQPNRNEQTESDGIKMCLFGDTTEIVS